MLQSVASHVERWAKENSHAFAAGRAIDARAVFQSKPPPDTLFNANPDGGGGGGANVTRYESHAGPVLALAASPFHRHLFASAGADGLIKVSSLLQHKPLLCLDPAGIVNKGAEDGGGGNGGGGGGGFAATGALLSGGGGASIFDVQWSHTRPMVFAAVASNGRVYLYDLERSLSVPVSEVWSPAVPIVKSSVKSAQVGLGEKGDNQAADGSSAASSLQGAFGGGAPVHAVSFNPKMRGFLAFGDAAGGVHVYKIDSSLAEAQPGEAPELSKLAASLSDDGDI